MSLGADEEGKSGIDSACEGGEMASVEIERMELSRSEEVVADRESSSEDSS